MNIYTISDQQGAQHQLGGGVFVTHQQRVDTAEEAEASGQAIGTHIPSVGLPGAGGRVITSKFYGVALAAGYLNWDE